MIGEIVDHYKIIEKIGEGGMGVVYKAKDLKLLRFVALKFLPPSLTRNESNRKRFVSEARTASSLDHPNICNVHEISETADGQLYIVMSYYEGQSLKDKLSHGSLPFSKAINIIYQIALGLKAAHSNNIVHRDIKPANIIITDNGETKILDFGLAQLDDNKLTTSITPKGTVSYMSPNVILDRKIDHETDLWSLGVVFYEMITRHLPFEGKYSEPLMYSIVNEEPTPLSDYVKNIPNKLENIITKLLSKNKKEKYSSIEEFLIDLQPLLEEHISLELKARSIGRRRSDKRIVYYAAAVLMAVVSVTLLLYFGSKNSDGNSLVLIPVINQNNDQEQEVFSNAVTEDLTTKLAQIGSLRVKSKTSALKYSGTDKTPQDIADEIGADFIVEVFPQKSADQVRISARIISTDEDEYIWAKEYEDEINNILIMQSEIAESIAKQIQVELTPEESLRISQSREVNPELYSLYTKGLYYLSKLTAEDVKKGLNYLQQAVAIDSTDPLPYAQLALGYCHIAHSTSPEALDALNRAGELALKALALDENIPEAHLALAIKKVFYDWDLDGGLISYRRALGLNPSLIYARWQYGFFLFLINKRAEGLNELELTKYLDPLSPFYPAQLGVAYCLVFEEYDKAIDEAELALELDPNFLFANFVFGQAYMGKKMYKQAIEYQKILAEKLFDWKFGLAQAYAEAGNTDEALEIAGELENRNSDWDTWCLAMIYASLGDRDKTLYWLEEAYKRKHPYILWIRTNYPFEFLSKDERYISLTKRLHIDKYDYSKSKDL